MLVTTSTSAKHTKRQEPHPLDTVPQLTAMEGGDLTGTAAWGPTLRNVVLVLLMVF